jgi:ferredoxin-nitrate reductase
MKSKISRIQVEHQADAVETRDAIADIWGPRTGYNASEGIEWPVRVDEHTCTKPDKWVQSACVL